MASETYQGTGADPDGPCPENMPRRREIVRGSMVEWTSTGRGIVTKRRGKVVAVIAPGARPTGRYLKRLRDPGQARTTVSYLVVQGKTLYWPRSVELAGG